MSELTSGFLSLPPEYQRVLSLAQDQHGIRVAPLQTLVGGWSGAMVYLVSVTDQADRRVEHFILKLDRKSKTARSDESSRHVTAKSRSPAAFAQHHIAELAFESVEADGAIAIFYSIAGQSLQAFRPLSNYGRQDQLETIFAATHRFLVTEWNAAPSFAQAVHPRDLLAKWLGFRLDAGAPVEGFIREVCRAHPDRPGFLIEGAAYPNPLQYARQPGSWGKTRAIDAITGLQHGDMNTNNSLIRFSADGKELTGYYLIDFALFKEEMPLFYDLRYLEMSYLAQAMSQVSFAKVVELILHLVEGPVLDPRRAPIELTGVSAVLASARNAFEHWVTTIHPSLQDDLWGQYWLAGVAAGLTYCHKAALPEEQRLAGLISAAANLRRYAGAFSVPLPTDVELLYDSRQKAAGQAPPRVATASPSEGAPPAGNVDRRDLPTPLAAFIGREEELTAVKGLLSDPERRLVTILAPGGMGKTRLSLEAAHQMREAFPDGLHFVALDRIDSAGLIPQAVAEALPISLSSNEDPGSRATEYLRDRAALLVMDNFEHVLEGATFVLDLLKAAPRLHVLATSRVKLNLAHETLFAIGGLTVDAAQSDGGSAAQLFAQSARRIQPAFVLDGALPAVTRICQLVGGMPLAIVLAGAWIDTLSVDEIASEIERSTDVLETELRDVADRQRSVRAVIEFSWNQVDAAAQDLLMRLSVFRGGFTRAAAQGAAGASLRGLSQLVDKALVRRDPATGRYSIHELLRQYAEERLKTSGDLERSAHERHAIYFADFVKAAWIRMRGDQFTPLSIPALDADFDNIRIAWDYAAETQDVDRLLACVDCLWLWGEVTGAIAPAIRQFGDAASKLVSQEPRIQCGRAQLRARQAYFSALIGMPDEGLRMAQESLDTLRRLSPEPLTFELLNCVCINAIFMNRGDALDGASLEMLACADRTGVPWDRGWACIWRSFALLLQGQMPEAVNLGTEALTIFERLNNPIGFAVAAIINLGSISMASGDLPGAKAHLLRGLQAAESIKAVRLRQVGYDNLGTVALLQNDLPEARRCFLESLGISKQSGQTREMLASLRDLARVDVAEGNLERALELLAVVLNHPASDQNSLNRPERLRDEAERLRAQLASQLDPARFQSAWESGGRQRLVDVVATSLR